nr:putative ribonuclease H-like domain-containing protein [Tanacetum cinerariifolium]
MVFKNPLETWKIEMVLQGEEENKIVATVKESICPKFEKYLEEGKCFYIYTFSIGDSQGTPRIVETKIKSIFIRLPMSLHVTVTVDQCMDLGLKVLTLSFKRKTNLAYLIGDLISCGTIAHAMVDGNRHPYMRLELEDLTLIKNRSHEGDDHCVTHLTTFSSYSIKNDFLNNLPKVCINDILDIGKAMSCVIISTIKKIERESEWWYLACVKCNHKANQDTVTEKDEYGVIVKKRIVFMCTNKACGQDTNVEYKYKIPLRVMDSTGSVSLTLFDKQALSIIDKSAAELLQVVRKKGDMDILPADFNKLLEKTYAFKVDIKDFNIEKDKHAYDMRCNSKNLLQKSSPSLPLPPPKPPDEEFDFENDFENEILVVRNTIVKFECIDARIVFNEENDDLSYFMFAMFDKIKEKNVPDEPISVHLYRSMIGCLMYLTATRPDIMFAVCAAVRHQVTPKTSNLWSVKRIFKYLTAYPKLGLWYPRDSPFDLEAFSDSDYAGANRDRKSTTGGCQFLGRRLISWQCKKQTIVATSSCEAEYVAAASCCAVMLTNNSNEVLPAGMKTRQQKQNTLSVGMTIPKS